VHLSAKYDVIDKVKKHTCIICSKRPEIYLSLDKNLMLGILLCFMISNKC